MRIWIVGLLLFPHLSTAFASVQVETGISLGFEHDALTCMSTSEFPLVEAEFEPAALTVLTKAQVYFKASRTEAWYFVEMAPAEESRLRAILPRPLAETDRVEYYLFFLAGSFEPAQTEPYSVHVSETGCGTIPGAASSPASLTLHATVANQPPVPPGFNPQGISSLVTISGNTITAGSAAAAGGGAASGGLSGVAIGAVAGGAAAAAAAAAVAVAGGGSDNGGTTASPNSGTGPQTPGTSSPSPSPDPTPTPSPSPSPGPAPTPSTLDVSGTWFLDDRVTESCLPGHVGRTSRTGMAMQQNATALTASRDGPNYSENLTGTIDAAGHLSLRGPFVDEGETGEAQWEATTTTGSDMTGVFSRLYPEQNCTVRWTFTGSKQ